MRRRSIVTGGIHSGHLVDVRRPTTTRGRCDLLLQVDRLGGSGRGGQSGQRVVEASCRSRGCNRTRGLTGRVIGISFWPRPLFLEESEARHEDESCDRGSTTSAAPESIKPGWAGEKGGQVPGCCCTAQREEAGGGSRRSDRSLHTEQARIGAERSCRRVE